MSRNAPNCTKRPKILVQLDTDPQASVFDRVVAVDAGVEQLFSYAQVSVDQVQSLVHGVIFTRRPEDLKHSAIFIGGSDVAAGEAILKQLLESFFGPLRVSVMLDANGANTTAAAAVLAARSHLDLADTRALVLAGTGPVGQRAARLLAFEGAAVALGSRSLHRATHVASHINQTVGREAVRPNMTVDDEQIFAALQDVELVIAAGASGVQLLPAALWKEAVGIKVAIDLNAVPPLGIEGLEMMDAGSRRDGVVTYGAIGIGRTKMKIHKAAIRGLFDSNDGVFDAEQIYELGRVL